MASGRGVQGSGDKVGAMVRWAAYIIGAELHGVPDRGQVQHHAPATMARLVGMFSDHRRHVRWPGGGEESSGDAQMASFVRCGGRKWRQTP
jgi:hypothetical protein